MFIRPAFCEHPDLSGSWQLDVAASLFNGTPPPQAASMTIRTGPHKVLHFARVVKDRGDNAAVERTIESDWKLDNKYHPVNGGESGEVLAKWDGSVLLGKRETSAGPEDIRLVLNAGGSSMTETIASPSGNSTLIWRRR